MSLYLALEIYKHFSIPLFTTGYGIVFLYNVRKGADFVSTRTAKRYKVQIFVSLDLSALSEILAGGGIATIEMVLLEMEKSLIKELDKMLPREKK